MAFHEVRFPDDISRGARGGPERRTQIVELASGDEERNARWANSRRRYDVAYGIRRADDLAAVVAFFEARNGRLHGFRFKDWADFKSCLPSQTPSAFDQPLGGGSGSATAFQLVKRYTSGAQSWTRVITRPVAASVLVGQSVPEQAELLANPLDPRTGWSNTGALGSTSPETWGPYVSAYALGSSGAGLRQNPAGAMTAGKVYRAQCWMKQGSSPAARLNIRAQPGNLDSWISGPFAAPTVAATTAGPIGAVTAEDLGSGFWRWSFDLTLGAGFTTALLGVGNMTVGQSVIILGASLREPAQTGPASGWTVDPATGLVSFATPPLAGTILSAGFEFDVPVRFDSDALPVTLDLERLGSIPSIPLIEVRE